MERDFVSPFNKITIDKILKTVVEAFEGRTAKVILAGGLAMIAYGMKGRDTYDLDGEVSVHDIRVIEKVSKKLKQEGIVAELSDNISRWSMIDIPPDYRKRTRPYKKIKGVEFHLLSPLDLIISKLRVFREIDIEDSKYLMKKFHITMNELKQEAERAISISPSSTELSIFRKNLGHFEKIFGKPT